MKKSQILFWGILIFLIFPMRQARAEQIIRGVLLEVNAQDNEFTFKPSNLRLKNNLPVPSEINVKISEDTQLDGLDNLSELETGDVLSIEAEKSSSSADWNATSISRL